ncbi:MAG: hypothetical protein ISS45_09035 [Candidatus Omnitrophica bacterium]|nr:hypothetical protein [Candidatus Omnitrophota bacterium]
MDIQDSWEKALKNTEIIRTRVQGLLTHTTTNLPYIFLCESSMNTGDTVVRKGEVIVDKPSLILPSASPQFEGFDFEKEFHINEGMLTNFLLVRGVAFPSLQYNNKTYSVDIYEGGLKKAIQHNLDKLQRKEDVHTGLLTGVEDCWQFSVLIFICTQVAKSAETDVKKILEDLKKRGRLY